MKKTYKIWGIIALTAVIGFLMAACNDSASTPAPKRFITVTGIHNTYIGKFGTILLYPYPINSSTPTVYSMETISETTEFSLLNWKRDDPWSGKGNFRVTFLIYDSVDMANNYPSQYIYAGVLAENTSIKIEEKYTDMEWSLFIKK